LLVVSVASCTAWGRTATRHGLLIKVETSERLQAGQVPELVYLEDVEVSDLQPFESNSGRTHLTFAIDVSGERFSAIMYDGDWGNAEEVLFSSGTVNPVGLWDEYNGATSPRLKTRLKTQLSA
jgi:hypothetical protein